MNDSFCILYQNGLLSIDNIYRQDGNCTCVNNKLPCISSQYKTTSDNIINLHEKTHYIGCEEMSPYNSTNTVISGNNKSCKAFSACMKYNKPHSYGTDSIISIDDFNAYCKSLQQINKCNQSTVYQYVSNSQENVLITKTIYLQKTIAILQTIEYTKTITLAPSTITIYSYNNSNMLPYNYTTNNNSNNYTDKTNNNSILKECTNSTVAEHINDNNKNATLLSILIDNMHIFASITAFFLVIITSISCYSRYTNKKLKDQINKYKKQVTSNNIENINRQHLEHLKSQKEDNHQDFSIMYGSSSFSSPEIPRLERGKPFILTFDDQEIESDFSSEPVSVFVENYNVNT